MILDKITDTGRRRFMKLISGIGAGFLITDGKRVSAAKKDIKQIVEDIETEKVLQSHPKRHPDIQWEQVGECIVLRRKGHEGAQFRLNRTGTMIWKAFNGRYSPAHLSHLLERSFKIDAHRAHMDCICFIAELSSKGAILL